MKYNHLLIRLVLSVTIVLLLHYIAIAQHNHSNTGHHNYALDLITKEYNTFESIKAIEPVQVTKKKIPVPGEIIAEGVEYFTWNPSFGKYISQQKDNLIKLSIPSGRAPSMNLLLKKVDLFEDDFKGYTSSGEVIAPTDMGVFYWGIVEGDESSFVTINILEEEISGSITTHHETYTLAKLRDKEEYAIYRERAKKLTCATGEEEEIEDQLDDRSSQSTSRSSNPNNVVKVYLEVANKYVRHFGSVAATRNYFVGFFNQVKLFYANERVNIVINEMKIWDTPDPYNTTDRGLLRNRFGESIPEATYNDNNALYLFAPEPVRGMAWGLTKCGGLRFAMGYAETSYQAFPNFNFTMRTLAHELGHCLSSGHTHDCSWNNNNTQIDDCGNQQGSARPGATCYDPNNPILPNRGTIMGYCNVDLTLGFGPQPGDKIRNFVYNNDCINTAPLPPSSPTNEEFIDDRDARITYTGGKRESTNPIYYDNTCTVLDANDGTISLTFTGNYVAWHGLKNTDLGIAEIFIDGTSIGKVDCYDAVTQTSKLFEVDNLGSGSHTIMVVRIGEKNHASSNFFLVHDYFNVKGVGGETNLPQVQTPVSVPNLGGIYFIESVASGQRIEHNGSVVMRNGTNNNNQKWEIAPIAGNYSLKNIATGRYLEVPYAKCGSGEKVGTYTDPNHKHLQWIIEKHGNDYFFRPSHCTNHSLDRTGANDRTPHLWSFDINNINERFRLISTTVSPPPPPTNGGCREATIRVEYDFDANGIVEEAASIYAQSKIKTSATVDMIASKEVMLKPGFHAYHDSKFSAKIRTCNGLTDTDPEQQTSSRSNSTRTSEESVTNVASFSSSDIHKTPSFVVFPNPASSMITVEIKDLVTSKDPFNLTILDALGRVLYHSTKNTTNKIAISVADWSPGIYFGRIEWGASQNTFKLTKSQ